MEPSRWDARAAEAKVAVRALAALVVVVAAAVASGCSGDHDPAPQVAGPEAARTSLDHFPQPPGVALPAATAQALGAEVRRWVTSGLISGVTVAVETHAGSWSCAAGVDGRGRPLSGRSGVAVASITKTIVAAEVMTLARSGRVDLDQPASAYLPAQQAANGATVTQLLGMRSGLAQAPESLWQSTYVHPDRHTTAREALASVPAPTDEPGETYDYNNTNYWLLGEIIEEVTGKPLATAIRDDLAVPYGLSRMAFQDAERLDGPLARPGPDDDFDVAPSNTDYLPWRAEVGFAGAAGAVVADAPSIARFGYRLYGGLVLPSDVVEQMATFVDGYGLGTIDFRGSYLNVDAIGHVGRKPGSRAALMVFPAHGISVAILTSTGTEVEPFVQYLVKAGHLVQD